MEAEEVIEIDANEGPLYVACNMKAVAKKTHWDMRNWLGVVVDELVHMVDARSVVDGVMKEVVANVIKRTKVSNIWRELESNGDKLEIIRERLLTFGRDYGVRSGEVVGSGNGNVQGSKPESGFDNPKDTVDLNLSNNLKDTYPGDCATTDVLNMVDVNNDVSGIFPSL